MSNHKVRDKCAVCASKDLHIILDYAEVPLAGYFPGFKERDKEELFSLKLLFCNNCSLVQTDSIINADKLFKDYRYMSSIGLSGHFTSVASMLVSKFDLDKNSRVVEIGSNDGVLQKPFLDLGINVLGFEPAENISKVARDKGCSVVNDYFSSISAQKLIEKSSCDLVVSNNCFAHIDDIQDIVKGIRYILKPGGHFILEVSYLKDLVEKLQYDNIYHEHLYYYSLHALDYLFRMNGMSIVDFELIPIHSGSIRVYVQNLPNIHVKNVINQLNKEVEYTKLSNFNFFASKVKRHIKSVKSMFSSLRDVEAYVVGYGASGRANMLCNVCDITRQSVDYIVDESPERAGRYIAGQAIPIISMENFLDSLADNKPDYIVVFAWNYLDAIKEKLKGMNFKYITFFPTTKVHHD